MPVFFRAACGVSPVAQPCRRALGRSASLLAALLATGCANPGPPHPPSLQLPAPVQRLQAQRVGTAVRLTWTTPSQTTDRVPIRGTLTAEICRTRLPPNAPPGALAGRSCQEMVSRRPVVPGPAEAVDDLSGALLAEPSAALAYQVRLVNAAGRSAGNSAPVLAAAGQAPPPVARLQAASTAQGVRLTWSRSAGPDAAVELTRTQLSPAAGAAGTSARRQPGLLPAGRRSAARGNGAANANGGGGGAAVHLLGVAQQAADPGGTLDQLAQPGATYSYVAERVRTVRAAGQTLTLRSDPSAAVSLLVRDVAPPNTPAGLEALRDGDAVELSWEPDLAADLAGYLVFRAPLTPGGGAPKSAPPAAPWVRLSPQPVSLPAFEDPAPPPGGAAYRVSAIDRAGNQSAGSAPAIAPASHP